jgi:hypothetical protein
MTKRAEQAKTVTLVVNTRAGRQYKLGSAKPGFYDEARSHVGKEVTIHSRRYVGWGKEQKTGERGSELSLARVANS